MKLGIGVAGWYDEVGFAVCVNEVRCSWLLGPEALGSAIERLWIFVDRDDEVRLSCLVNASALSYAMLVVNMNF